VIAKDRRACPICSTLFPENSDWCPVCALRSALGKDRAISDSVVDPTLSSSQLRLDHYEILTGEDGTPLELVVDALLGRNKEAVVEAKRAVEILPVSKDAVDGPTMLTNLAVVYAWTDQEDLAIATLAPLAKMPCGPFYGQLKLDPLWDPLRNDPRFDKLLADLAPR